MRIALISANVSVRGGGVAVLTLAQARAFADAGHTVKVFAMNGRASALSDDVEIEDFPVSGPRRFGYAPGMVDAIVRFAPDVIHVHGLWMYPGCAARSAARKLGIPYFISPDGMLADWSLNNHALFKKIAALLYERKNLNHANCIFVNADSELVSMRGFGVRAPAEVLGNGIDIPDMEPRTFMEKPRRLLYLGRLHPKKNLKLVILGWHALRNEVPEAVRTWHLDVVGFSQLGYEEEMRALVGELGLEDQIEFHGRAEGNERFEFYRRSSAFILPSLSEGMPMAVLEAMAYRLPVILTPECNIPCAGEYGAAIMVSPDEASVCDGLRRLFLASDEKLRDMSESAGKCVRENFSWEFCARKLIGFYEAYGSKK